MPNFSCETEAYTQGTELNSDNHDHGHGHQNHGHGGHGGHNHSHGAPPIPTNESQSLNSKILTPNLSALNLANPQSDLPSLFKDRSHKYSIQPCFKSDADNQLILKIPFEGSTKLYSVILRTSNQDDHCPRTVKFYNGTRDLDFDSITSAQVTFEAEHPRVGLDDTSELQEEEIVDDSSFVEHYLPRNLFGGVSTLTIFFENNWSGDDDEPLHLYSVELRGEFHGLMKKTPVVTIYESAANPADHAKISATQFNFQDVE
ncbi:DEKNAAC101326 [Brettanomyces naardenensis]|uniref:DEKNAAC101326 n=1 Tax=Brettanomyces naardenensis TaxID=13370 RepID=A0A448YHY3_BRENA|nr:DEKNAAC101326 [Brettanomyces naardenensis]